MTKEIKKKLTIDEELAIMNCSKCKRTQQLHGTNCKEHKTPSNDPNQGNDSGIEWKFDDEDTVPLILHNQ